MPRSALRSFPPISQDTEYWRRLIPSFTAISSGFTPPPELYHLGSACCAVGATMMRSLTQGRRKRGRYPLRPSHSRFNRRIGIEGSPTRGVGDFRSHSLLDMRLASPEPSLRVITNNPGNEVVAAGPGWRADLSSQTRRTSGPVGSSRRRLALGSCDVLTRRN